MNNEISLSMELTKSLSQLLSKQKEVSHSDMIMLSHYGFVILRSSGGGIITDLGKTYLKTRANNLFENVTIVD